MIVQVQQTLDTLFWPLSRVLESEGISVLHWAVLKRAQLQYGGVRFADVIKATGQSKSNVRRAAEFLARSGLGEVLVDPKDRRARIFRLSRRGRDRTVYIEEEFQADMLVLLGANLRTSIRAREFTRDLLYASGYLPPGDLADLDAYEAWDVPDDSKRFHSDPRHSGPSPDPEEIPF